MGMADVLLCRAGNGGNGSVDRAMDMKVPFRGINSFSHALARRIGFSGVPVSTLIVIHIAMLVKLRGPCGSALWLPRVAAVALLVGALVLAFLAKVLLGAFLLGFSARRRSAIASSMDLFPRIKAL